MANKTPKSAHVRPSRVKPYPTGVYTSRMLLDNTNSSSEKIQVNHGTLDAGASLLPAGRHGTFEDPFDEVYVILSGRCKLHLGDEIVDLEPQDVVYIPGGMTHGLDNTEGTEPVELITVAPGVPPPGVAEVYENRLRDWGKTFVLLDDDTENNG